MRPSIKEALAGLSVLAALVVPPWAVTRLPERAVQAAGVRVIELTGVQKDGAWTDEPVDGTTYWRKTFKPAHLVLRAGEEVLLKLSSADVRHGFYAPELGVGPLTIDPGKVVEVRFTPREAGEFTYYCTEVCGHCHYRMKGAITVVPAAAPAATGVAAAAPCPHGQPPPADASKGLVKRGELLFREKACFTCHGERGSGGVHNPNYLADKVPQNNLLAEKMGLFEREEAQRAIALLEEQADLEALGAAPPFRSYSQFLAQLGAVRQLILNGNPAGKKDPGLYAPPLSMPSWRHHLSDRDVDAVIAYLLSEYPWEDE